MTVDVFGAEDAADERDHGVEWDVTVALLVGAEDVDGHPPSARS